MKRGMSAIIITVIMVALALVAVGIVWAVINNVISKKAEDISASSFMIDLDIKSVNIEAGVVSVRVKRKAGKGKLDGLRLVISDGTNSEVFKRETILEELGEQTFDLVYVGAVEFVSVAPVVKTESGKDVIGAILDTFEVN